MIEAVTDGLSGINNMGGMMRGLNPIQFVPLDRGAEEISTGARNHGLGRAGRYLD